MGAFQSLLRVLPIESSLQPSYSEGKEVHVSADSTVGSKGRSYVRRKEGIRRNESRSFSRSCGSSSSKGDSVNRRDRSGSNSSTYGSFRIEDFTVT